MDPTATLNELLDALRNHDRESAIDCLRSVRDWLSKDGAFPIVPEKPRSTEYQGWTNHATWAVHLWLTNDEGTYLFCRRLAREAVNDADDCEQVDDGIWTVEEARRYLLADSLGEYLEELNPLKDASLFSDLMTASLQDVNYEEAGFWDRQFTNELL
jgi:hypothetical protein